MVVHCTFNAGVSGSSPDWKTIESSRPLTTTGTNFGKGDKRGETRTMERWQNGHSIGLENRSPHGHGGSNPSLSANLRWASVPSGIDRDNRIFVK